MLILSMRRPKFQGMSDEAPLDSSDDEIEDETELIKFVDCLPVGMQVAPPPSQDQLVFKSATGKELKGKRINHHVQLDGYWVVAWALA